MKKYVKADSDWKSDVADMKQKLSMAIWNDVFPEYCYDRDIDADDEEVTMSMDDELDGTTQILAQKLVEYADKFPKIR